MDYLSIRISRRLGDREHAIEVNLDGLAKAPAVEQIAAAAPAPDAAEAQRTTATAGRFIRVAADGAHLAPAEAREHVAVIDTTTGLMWSIESLGDPDDEDDGITQEHCIERCKQLRLLGHDDWRLPTRAELVTLVDDTRHEPAIDTALFPKVKPRWHWTSTAAAWSSASAWNVNFSSGGVSSDHRGDGGFALAVRRAGQ